MSQILLKKERQGKGFVNVGLTQMGDREFALIIHSICRKISVTYLN